MYDFPPIPFIKQLSLHYPEVIHTYSLLWDKQDKEGFVTIEKPHIKMEYMIKPAEMERYIMLLSREGLINVIHDKDDLYELELVQWDYNFGELA